ncbi:TlpA family protein disulfide reductase [Virgisporangium aurantiacum]|uniref:Thioredoxin domain-containing protein n=1 Tax=Virgisporangium aurantiacum TaxID=175570 RepID=A0A8J3ZB43_9ACTN|nr:hypothetical protein [Virgisporangium aurantiacum]GIJ60889.1 hypothetical protein Vau01_084050 [Virgisporangium aurantiacum]
MIYLAVGVVIAVVLTLLNLVLMFGVIRRLRELQSRVDAAPSVLPDAGLPAGSPAPELTATTVSGAEVSSVDPARPTLIGFFSPGCAPCADRIPEFVDYAGTGVAKVAVVVTDLPAEGDDYVRRLSAVDVTVQPGQEAWVQGFAVTSYPTLCLVSSDGVVLGSGNTFGDLPTLSTV